MKTNLLFIGNRHISLALAIIVTLLASTNVLAAVGSPDLTSGSNADSAPINPIANSLAAFTKLNLIPNIETVGVVVSGANLPAKADLMYRRSGDPDWRPAHPLMRIDDGRLVGSLFGLSPATSYDIKVLDGSTEISGSITTQPDELQFTPSVILHVNDDALSGGDGSAAAPFKTIQEGLDHAGPGTQVLVADGIYREAVSFPTSGTEGNWIQVKAEGNGAILDGSENLSGDIWKPHPSKAHVWFTKIGQSIAYLARDQKRFYNYDNLQGLLQGRGHGKVSMNEGWYLEAGKLYVRSQDKPSSHTWQVPYLNHAFDAAGRDWIWIEGFEIRFYGTTTGGCGVCTINASHVVIRRNRIHNLQLGIFIQWTGGENQGNDTRIEFNQIYDPPVNEWPWKAVKGSSMEGTAIVIRGRTGAIVRGNELHHFFNGIYTGSSGALENSALAFDADIYNNHIHHISDDALEPEGACINQRFRNNTVDTVLVGISLAPITQGPTWILRSSFTNFTGRSIKWDAKSDGIVLIYHNTSWTDAKNLGAMDMISPVRNAVMRNNIFRGNGYAFNEPFTGSMGNDWNYDNWNTTRGTNNPHFMWENVRYNTIAKLCAATGLECNGYEDPPGLTNPSGGDFTLLSSSPNIDRGIIIPGINDIFTGNAPDVGAFEFTALAHSSPVLPNARDVAVQASNGTLIAKQDIAIAVVAVNNQNPVITSNGMLSIAENTTVVTTVTATDADLPIQTLTYSIIGGADSALFSINSSSGELTFINAPNYELPMDAGVDNVYNVTVQAFDGTLTVAQDVVITVTAVNDNNPVITSNGILSIAENTTAVTTVTATDADLPIQTLTYSIIGGADSALFSINSSSGELTFINAPDYELSMDAGVDNIYNLTVQASDGTLIATQDIAVTVTAINDNNPVITSNGILSIAENTTAVATVTATDADLPIQTLTYSINGGADSALFSINSFSGELTFINAPDYELPMDADVDNIYNLTVQASDGTLIAAQDIAVIVTAINDNNPVITSNGILSIAENTTAVATVTATDADLPAQTLTYSISGGTDSTLFSINSSTGDLTLITAPDYELPMDAGLDNIYNLTVQASDGTLVATQDIAITVTAINDNYPVITSNGILSIAENTTAVAIVIATDADLPAQTLTYSISGGADSHLFSINSSSGDLTFTIAPDYELPIDAGTDNIYNVTVQASDGMLTTTQDIAVTVTAINDNNPVIASNGILSIAENTTAVTTVIATDADLPAQTLTYSISGGADAALFSINSFSGELTFINAPDYELPMDAGVDNIYNLTVQASDGTLKTTQSIAVTVTNIAN